MKKSLLLITTFFCLLTLLSCATTSNPQINQDLLKENWLQTVNLDARSWTQGASRWFFTGDMNTSDTYTHRTSLETANSVTAIKVPQFTNVELNGCFRVQMVGGQQHNTVTIFGPNEMSRQISVQIFGDTVRITQAIDEKGHMVNLKNVIVRIGVQNLHQLKIAGFISIEARGLTSNNLEISSSNNDNVLLSGEINLSKVTHTGMGIISVLCAYTPCLHILVNGSGTVNVSGRVGIQSINNTGGTVHIIGADSRYLIVNACENGYTTIAGYVNLKRLIATGKACVYIYWVNSRETYVTLRENAYVGLAGATGNLDINLSGNAFLAAQFLHSENIYLQTHDNSHANIAAKRKIFAAAADTSSIYFYGSPNNVSRYTTGRGSVIHVWGNTNALPIIPAFS